MTAAAIARSCVFGSQFHRQSPLRAVDSSRKSRTRRIGIDSWFWIVATCWSGGRTATQPKLVGQAMRGLLAELGAGPRAAPCVERVARVACGVSAGAGARTSSMRHQSWTGC